MTKTRITKRDWTILRYVGNVLRIYIDVLIFAGIWRSLDAPSLATVVFAIGTAMAVWWFICGFMRAAIADCYEIVPEYEYAPAVPPSVPMEEGAHSRILEGTRP
jgi:hypothetical protein